MSNEKAPCKCGSKNCTGFIGDFPKNSRQATNNGSDQAKTSNSKNKPHDLQVDNEQKLETIVAKGRKSEAPIKVKAKKARKSIA